jgi:hypothetical protein
MSFFSLDNIALGCCIGAVIMRSLHRPWLSNVLSSLSLLSAGLAQRAARLRSHQTQA